jgi:DedD protein
LLEGKPVQAEARDRPAAADGRFVVQVGAFADAVKAREARLKVEKSGLKTYTHVAETKDGKRIRVRVGPFATRSEADKAASKIKELDLPAAILTL